MKKEGNEEREIQKKNNGKETLGIFERYFEKIKKASLLRVLQLCFLIQFCLMKYYYQVLLQRIVK